MYNHIYINVDICHMNTYTYIHENIYTAQLAYYIHTLYIHNNMLNHTYMQRNTYIKHKYIHKHSQPGLRDPTDS